MKKNILKLAIAAVCVIGLTACPTTKTTTDYLVGAKKGWVISAGTSTPAYEMNSGLLATDLVADKFFTAGELQDAVIFLADGTQKINPGSVTDVYTNEVTCQSKWSLSEDEKTLNFQVPFCYNEDYTLYDIPVESVQLISVTDKELRISFNFRSADPEAKDQINQFTITYVPKK